uniref:Plancitoxin-1 n=2 Tax=Schistocephalus solidus TaxID=70667 RepID=A0A0X3PWB9_SCHSO
MLISVLLLGFIASVGTITIGCRDENNELVDWFIAYKFPHGFSYAYISPTSLSWSRSHYRINSEGAIRFSFDQVFNNSKNSLVYGMYNDEKPSPQRLTGKESNGPWWGHMKGIFAFPENKSGFWMIHSVPKLSEKFDAFQFPPTARHYAQHFLCLSLSFDTLGDIANQLLIARPLIQSFNLPDSVASRFPALQLVLENKGAHNASTNKSVNLTTLGGELQLLHFSKSNKFGQDLYKNWIALELNSSLIAECWRHDRNDLPSDCSGDFWVRNALHLKWPSSAEASFNSTVDHSKWAVTDRQVDDRRQWICLGDINRAESQFHRGGGAMCINNSTLWKLFYDIIHVVENCPLPHFSALPLVRPWLTLVPADRM